MGDPVPTEYPEFETLKYYWCTCQCFWDVTPKLDCTQEYLGDISAAVREDVITWFIGGGLECTQNFNMIEWWHDGCQKVTGARGPYDTQQACIDDNT